MNGPKGITVQFKILNVLELIMNLFVNVKMVSKEMVQNLVYLRVSRKKKMVRKHKPSLSNSASIMDDQLLCQKFVK